MGLDSYREAFNNSIFHNSYRVGLIQEPGESRREWLLYLFRSFAEGLKQNKEFVVWQKTNHPTELSQPQIYDQKVGYLIMNPVVSGYVTDETDWKYSSAGKLSPLKLSEGGEEFDRGRLMKGHSAQPSD